MARQSGNWGLRPVRESAKTVSRVKLRWKHFAQHGGSLVVVTDHYEHRTLQEAAIYAGRAAGVFTSDGLSRSSGFCMIVTLTPNPEREPVHRRVTNVRIGFSGWNSRHLLAAIRR